MNYIELFKKSAALYADKPALADFDGTRLTSYSELDRLSGRIAGKLRAAGCVRGDFVVINMDRRMEYQAAYLGILKAGCAVVPTVPDYPRERVEYISADCGAKLTVTEKFLSDVREYEIFEEPAEDTEAGLLVYTSGSTGTPKGILHSAADLARAALRQQEMFRGIEPVIFGAAGQMSFMVHCFEYLTVFLLGGTAHILSDSVRKSPKALSRYYASHNVTIGWIVPQMLKVFKPEPGTSVCALAGGERMSNIAPDGMRILNIYGMSEFTGPVTTFPLDRTYDNTPIGKPFADTEIIVCDENGRPVPDGAEGEICVLGSFDTVYFKDAERTRAFAEKLADGRKKLHSGDIGRINENGDLVFVNRRDWMVKVNGQRVDTLGIEILLRDMPELSEAVIKAFEDEEGQTYLAAYYVADKDPGEAELRRRLMSKVPAYMLPRFFVKLEAMPKNDNGKLDRLSLPLPDKAQYKAKYSAPANGTEAALCRAFEEVLRCGTTGADDDFFALGGDSIKVMRLINAAGLEKLTPDMVLTGKTPRAVAALLEAGTGHRTTAHLNEIPAVTPLTEAQKGVYLQCVSEPGSCMYNIPMFCRLPDGTDTERFSAAVKAAAEKHPALKVRVGTPDGIPSMLYRDAEITVSVKTAESLEEERGAFVRPFDLENGPLYRFELCLTPEGNAFMLDVHHLVFDGSSVEVLLADIAKQYMGEELPEETVTMFDVSASEQGLTESAEYASARAFFREKLDGVDWDGRPVPDMVFENGEAEPSGAGRIIMRTEDKFKTRDILAFTKKNGITENTLFLTAFAYALAKFNGAAESTFCTVNSGRHDTGLASSVGMFVKTLPMHFSFDENAPLTALLNAAQKDFFRTMGNDCISFGELAADYGVGADVVFVYQSELFKGAELDCGTLRPEFIETGDSQSDIDFMLSKDGSDYELTAHYRRGLYTEGLISSFARTYLNIVAGMLTADRLTDISLTDAESKAVLDGFNRTETEWNADRTIVGLFREQVKRTPDRTCLVFRDRRYTYAETDSVTDRLAKLLAGKGFGRGDIAGVLIPRSEFMLLCSMGILKAGGAYLPLDPAYPPERLSFMLRDSGARLLIAAPELDSVIGPEFEGERMSTDEILGLEDSGIQLPEPGPEDLFVMLYTSGSTGTPKGVEFSHANAHSAVEFFIRYFGMNGETKLASYASYGFDAHVIDIYPPVLCGGELHIIEEDIRLDLAAVREYFNNNGINHCVMTTQVGRQFAMMPGHKTLRHLSVAGEKLTPLAPPEGMKFYNLYGPTEGSVITSAFTMDRQYKDVPIGQPVDNLKAYIVDRNGALLPQGAVGELWIAGPHVTRGYHGLPEKTAEAYGANPFENRPGYGRVYRTGDIVRFMPDGNLQFIGRRDAQVKIRGFRIELTEVEEVIRRYPGITDATVAAFDDPSGGKYICAYVVSENKVSTEELSDFIRAEKPPYMVPAVTMQIDRIPLNQNHKVNRKALPVPERKAADLTPPENETQRRIFDITAEILGHSAFGINTDLYNAGLTSIGSVRLNVALADAFDIPVKISDIKANSTVRLLENFISSACPAEDFPLQDDYPLSENQKGIFVECMANPGTTVYNIPLLLRISERLDNARLLEAVKAAVNAHPYIKTVLFNDAQGNVRAKRQDSLPPVAEFVRCDTLPEFNELRRPFTLLNAPLYRAYIYETADGSYLYLDLHHIISDGTGETVLLRDIERAYNGEALQAERFSGFEAALAEEKLRGGAEYERARLYWTALLSNTEGTTLPAKAPDVAKGAGYIRRRDCGMAAAVRKFCSENGMTLNAFFNSAFSYVLSRYAGTGKAAYATIYNGRSDSRLASSVTMLVKTLPVTAELKPDRTVKDYILNMQDQLMGSMGNDVCSFAELAAWYGVDADIVFAYQGDDFGFDTLCGEPARLIELPPETPKATLAVNVYLTGDHFEYTAEYDRASYSERFMSAMLDALEATAESFMKAVLLKDISIMSGASEKTYALMNDSACPVEQTAAHEFVERFAASQPSTPAIYANGVTLTFRELNEKANVMAHRLRAMGAGAGQIIGLVLERSVEVAVTELAIMKSGGAFLPIVPSYPDERIGFCLENAESPFVITSEAIKAERTTLFAEGRTFRTLTVEELLGTGGETADLDLPVNPEDLVYCIYTSGSTGTPKGVMIEHRNLSNFVQTDKLSWNWFTEENAGGASLAAASISFDMSLTELWMPLCSGRTVCMATEEEFHNPLLLTELMRKNNVRCMACTPSFLGNMLGTPGFDDVLRGMRSIAVGAEAFPAGLYEKLHGIAPGLQIINGYGPTETTQCSSNKTITGDREITIGRPIGNTQYYVIDSFGNIMPPYAAGELIICGAGVGRGYVKLPEKTAAAFFTLRGLPAYHSGDRVRVTADAEIEFCGRMDNQIKLRGFRVELDEIEKVMCEYPGVRQSKVTVRNNGSEDYLAGFFTASEPVSADALTEHLKSRLTYYMVPAVLMQLDRMPLTANGKIDKNALPETKQTRAARSGRRAAKKSLEQRLCEIFASVLGLEEVYADDSFFEIGGTSLSASKVTMLLMSESIEVKYGDIFDNPTPEALAEFIEKRDSALKKESEAPAAGDTQNSRTRPALEHNTVKYAKEVRRESLGNVLLTGAVGFLGIHILKELLDIEQGHIYCLVRKGSYESPESRLKTMYFYYFSEGLDEALKNRVTLISADVTDASLADSLADIPFDTVINCAACVKHFADDDIIERINVRGVENLISICKARGKKLIQISTTSVPGLHTKETWEKQLKMHENELFVIDDMDNKYGISKYHAELRMFDAIEDGMRGKVMRCGNLMGRHSDGEFQVNLETNMFLSGLRGFATMGRYPISHMTDPMGFSPVDCTARAIVLLAGTNDMFTAFNCDNRYHFDEMKIIDACNRNGITILPADDEEYYAAFREKLADEKVNSRLNGLAAYDIPDAHSVETDNLFTTNILYRIGFSWPLVDDSYLDRAINSIMTLDYFGYEDEDSEQ